MSDLSHCINCGAPVNYKVDSCEYCGSMYNPYEVMNARRDAADLDHVAPDKLARLVEYGVVTPNEARKQLGVVDNIRVFAEFGCKSEELEHRIKELSKEISSLKSDSHWFW